MKVKVVRNNIGCFILLFFSLLFIQKNVLMGQRLEDHLWKHRVLLLFSPDENEAVFREQYKAFMASEKKVRDRDLVLYQVFHQNGKTFTGEPMPSEKVDNWRQKWQVRPEVFLLVLIGKDGGTKYKTSKRIDPSVIFDLIDSMPMRQAEMRDSAAGKPKTDGERSN